MRHFLTIFALTTLCFSSFGQKQSIDTFIGKIDNQQIVVMMQYVWYPKMFSPAGDSLIKVGKPATDKLIPLLSDTSKGIITHYILSNIWADKLEKAGQTLGSNVHQVDNDETAVLGILYTDFIFFQDNNRHNFSRQADLERNKQRWLTFFKLTLSSKNDRLAQNKHRTTSNEKLPLTSVAVAQLLAKKIG